MHYLFSSESVSEGHPDKICDAVSDAILDLYIQSDPEARTAIECLATTNLIVLAGETRSNALITKDHINDTVRQTVKNIGYDQENFHWQNLEIINRIHEQSADIAQGVDANLNINKNEGAGDQGIMFGYACNETEAYMPAAIHYCNRILERLAKARKTNEIENILPDSKTQLTFEYKDNQIIGLTKILLSTQHSPKISQQRVKEIVIPIIEDILPKKWDISKADIFINPTGSFVIGGPDGDTGLTGRKIIVDTYGGVAPHGGGAFSGKDPTKVDRSAAYAARHLAKNIVASGLMDKCVIQLAYAIGVSKPLSMYINDYGTAKIDMDVIYSKIQEIADFRPRMIRKRLHLNKPIYSPTSSYGHFGREPTEAGHFSWEKLDLVEKISNNFSL